MVRRIGTGRSSFEKKIKSTKKQTSQRKLVFLNSLSQGEDIISQLKIRNEKD